MPKAEQEPGTFITAERLEEFEKLYRKEFGVHLSDAEALDKAIPFLELVKAVRRPIPTGAETQIPAPEKVDASNDQTSKFDQKGEQLRLL